MKVPHGHWQQSRSVTCEILHLPEDGAAHLKSQQTELELLYKQFDDFLDDEKPARKIAAADGKPSNVIPFKTNSGKKLKKPSKPVQLRIEDGKLVVTKLAGEKQSDSLPLLENLVSERFPKSNCPTF